MALHGRFNGRANGKSRVKNSLIRSRVANGRDVYRREERIRIAPKHPGMGRR